MKSAAEELKRALGASFANFRGYSLDSIGSRGWASATFTGARHELVVCLEGAGAARVADAFVNGLDAREFDLRDHIVADIALVEEERRDCGLIRLSLEALTVESA